MKIKLTRPWSSASGTYKTTDLIYYGSEEEVVARSKPEVAKPDSAQQRKVQKSVGAASANWKNLSPAQRAAWQQYADRYCSKNECNQTVHMQGHSVYVRVNTVRQAVGLGLATDAPTQAPPLRLREITQGSGAGADGIAIVVHHDYRTTEGYLVVVRVTAAIEDSARTPKPGDYHYVCGLSSASAQPLPASGGRLIFSPVRTPVKRGQRFCVEARIMRVSDGTVSTSVYGDFVKK